MKLAFLFLTVDNHHQPEIWQSFFAAAPQEQYSIYCHPKFSDRVTQGWLRCIDNLCDTQHGHISLVRAHLNLLRAAFADTDNEYFILLSESCVPLYSFSQLNERLKRQQASWISYGFDSRDENHARWQHLQPSLVSLHQFRKQHQWVVLKRDAVAVLLDGDDTAAFETMYAPDEYYVINILLRRGADVRLYNMPATFVNWEEYEVSRGASAGVSGGYPQDPDVSHEGEIKLRPRTYQALTPDDVLYARSNRCLFLRKVSPACNCRALGATDESWNPVPVPVRTARGPFYTVIAPASGPSWPDDVEVVAMAGVNSYEAINQALQQATGQWIHIVPVGHQIGSDFHVRMRPVLESLPQHVGVAFCRHRILQPPIEPGSEGDEQGMLDDDWLAGLLDGASPCLAAVLVRRAVFEHIGGFSPDLPARADWEWYLRAAIHYRWWYQPERLVTCPTAPQEDAEERRIARMRAAIHWHRAYPERRLPWGLRPPSGNFMIPEEPD